MTMTIGQNTLGKRNRQNLIIAGAATLAIAGLVAISTWQVADSGGSSPGSVAPAAVSTGVTPMFASPEDAEHAASALIESTGGSTVAPMFASTEDAIFAVETLNGGLAPSPVPAAPMFASPEDAIAATETLAALPVPAFVPSPPAPMFASPEDAVSAAETLAALPVPAFVPSPPAPMFASPQDAIYAIEGLIGGYGAPLLPRESVTPMFASEADAVSALDGLIAEEMSR